MRLLLFISVIFLLVGCSTPTEPELVVDTNTESPAAPEERQGISECLVGSWDVVEQKALLGGMTFKFDLKADGNYILQIGDTPVPGTWKEVGDNMITITPNDLTAGQEKTWVIKGCSAKQFKFHDKNNDKLVIILDKING